MEKNLLRQLKSLNKIQPSTEWRDSAREDILAQIMSEDAPQKFELWAEFLYFIRFSARFFNDFLARPVGTLALVLVLVFGGGVIKVKADSSLPGDLLYSLKRGGEKMHIAFIFNEDRRSDLRLNLISERVRELNEVVYKKDLGKEEKIREAFENFHKDFTPVKNSLASINGNSGNRLIVAQKVEDKTSELSFILSNVKNKIEENMEGEVVMAINDVNMVNLEALEVIVGDAGSNKDSVIARKIDDKIEEVGSMVGNIDTTDNVMEKLDEAKEELMVGNFVAALQKVKESNEILSNNDNKNTTSTDVISGADDDIAKEPSSTVELIDEIVENSTTTSSND